jgi:hypothetical protein
MRIINLLNQLVKELSQFRFFFTLNFMNDLKDFILDCLQTVVIAMESLNQSINVNIIIFILFIFFAMAFFPVDRDLLLWIIFF